MAAIGDVFAEDDHAVVMAHFLFEGGVDQVRHGAGLALRLRLNIEGRGGGVHRL